ncbi:peptidylprolyl isomerase [Crenobacter caeni]|uniref:Chaperone SurA n=1 Tax=Crenobacter caeni TaxID=2705474 RepID=A0A6B2KMQ1_9NEIS|nr:peptidylprolyl isomerase [Crenobacter caeni]NDV11465.1 molecular chaperone SurA [Crenobacter caeni]
MKRTLIAACLAGVFTLPASAAVTTVDRIVAVVGKDAVTLSDVNARLAQVEAGLKRQGVPLPPAAVLQRQVLDQLLLEKLQLQYAASNGVRVGDGELDDVVSRLARQNGTDVAGLRARLAKDGTDYAAFRENLRKEVLLERLRERVASSQANVSDQEVEQVLASAQNAKRAEYRIANILVSVPERADAKQIDAARQKIGRAQADLAAGKPFAQVAASYSDAKNALAGGEIGWRGSSALPPELVGLLDALAPGQHTDVVRTPSGFYLFQLIEKRDRSAPQMVEQYRVRHILIRTNEAVSEADARTRIEQVRDRLQQGAKFDELARRFSEDGSAPQGGDLGWMNKGDTVPEFERAMLALKPGETSAPVRSPFGYHLIRLENTRTQDVSGEREKAAVKQEIRQRKAEQAYQDWLQQLKDSAYIEDKLSDD